MDPATEEYTISSVTLTAPGSGYTNGAYFAYSMGSVAASPCSGEPVVNVVVGHAMPTLAATVSSATGQGAALSVSVSGPFGPENEETYGVSGVTIQSAGGRYRDDDLIVFTKKSDTIEQKVATAKITVEKRTPQVFAFANEDFFYRLPVSLTDESPGHTWGVKSATPGQSDPYYGDRTHEGKVLFTTWIDTVELSAASATFSATSKVESVSLASGGSKFTSVPVVSFNGGGGSGAAATAAIRGGVDGVAIANGGSGYTSNPTVVFSGGGGSGAMAAAYIEDGAVTSISLTSPGFGYESAPSVTITGGGGTGATASAWIDASVISLQLTSQGQGYVSEPEVVFSGGGGSGAIASASLGSIIVDVNVTNGGEYYGGGGIQSVEITAPGEYYVPDGVQSVDLAYGGSFYPTPFCEYTWRGCEPCVPLGYPHIRGPMRITFNAGGESHSLSVVSGLNLPIVDAVQSSEGGNWETLTFASESFYPGVASISLQAGGSGYTSPPSVIITGDGINAEATATVRGYVDSVSITNQGSGYSSSQPPAVVFSGGGGSGATATVAISNGRITAITIGSGGSGYSSAPAVTISGGVGSGATAVATARQSVESVTVTKRGSGYTVPPLVSLDGGGGAGAIATATLDRQPVGCKTSGTAALSPVACSEPSRADICEMPDQISLSLSGMGEMTVHRNNAGLAFPWTISGPLYDECGLSRDATAVILYAGATIPPILHRISGVIQDAENVILDLEYAGCDGYVYRGLLPSPMRATFASYATWIEHDCGGSLGQDAEVRLTPIGVSTAIQISPPTKSYGSTATAEVSAIGENGSVDSVVMLTQGFGYAVEIVERVEPEVVVGIATESGAGAALSVTLQGYGAGDEAYWSVSSVAVASGGTGYSPAEMVAFSTADTEEYQAQGYIVVSTTEPTLSAAAGGGEGAEFSVSLAEFADNFGSALWAVDSVSVTSGGSGYADGSQVVFTVVDGEMQFGASATIATGREEPEVAAVASSYYGGQGAVLAATLSQSGDTWHVSGVTVSSGGAGYGYGDYVYFETDDTALSPGYGYAAVDENGAITSVSLYDGGQYYRASDVIESVTVTYGGAYYKRGPVESVVLYDGGAYWRAQGTGEADADEPTVAFASESGINATATATVDSEIGSPTFGQITGLAITNGGSGYALNSSGWRITVSLSAFDGSVYTAGFSHLDGAAAPQSPVQQQGDLGEYECANFAARYKPMANRVVVGICPNDLLNREFEMAIPVNHDNWPTWNNGVVGEAVFCNADTGYYLSTTEIFYELGNGPFTISLAPA
jgi:hypothetical protein